MRGFLCRLGRTTDVVNKLLVRKPISLLAKTFIPIRLGDTGGCCYRNSGVLLSPSDIDQYDDLFEKDIDHYI